MSRKFLCVFSVLLLLASGTFLKECYALTSIRHGIFSNRHYLKDVPDAGGLSVGTVSRFSSALDWVARQGTFIIIAEDCPGNPRLDPDKAEKLLRSLKDADAKQKLIEIAKAYDYDAMLFRDSVYLLEKHYSDAGDFPFVTKGEALNAFLEAEKLISNLLPGETAELSKLGVGATPTAQLAKTIRQEQLALLGSSSGLTIADLSPIQRRLLWLEVVNQAVLGDVASLDFSRRLLTNLDSDKSEFVWQEIYGTPVFSFRGPFGRNGTSSFLALSHGFRTSSGGGTYITGQMISGSGARIDGGKLIGKLNDPLAPEPSKLGNTPRDAEPNGTINLGDLIRDLQSGLTDQTAKVRYEVDEAIAAKPISVFLGPGKRLDLDLAVAAVAEIYGLRVAQTEDGHTFLTLRKARLARNFDQLGLEIHRLLPTPFLHYVSGMTDAQASAVVNKERSLTGRKELSPERQRAILAGPARQQAAETAYQRIVKELRARVQPEVDSEPGKRMPANLMDNGAERLMVLLILANSVHSLDSLTRMPMAPALTNFDKIVLFGDFSDSGGITGFRLRLLDDDGHPIFASSVGIPGVLAK